MENSCEWYDPTCAIAWLANEIKLFFLWVIDGIFSGVAVIFEAIPVPAFLLDIDPVPIPEGIIWASEMFLLKEGLAIVVAAYIIRFGIRRIPIIG